MRSSDSVNTPTSQLPSFPASRRTAALLWDESFLWGLMALKAIEANGLSCDLIRSDDVRNGRLKEYSLLFVPGGWASNKVKALGIEGVEAIKRFVHDGGAYLGFCGGAGLATQDGIGLVSVKRRPTKERVPSFSGRVRLITSDHALWQGISEPIFHAWWPSQFLVDKSVSVLATYGSALPDSFSSDLNVGDVDACRSWSKLEGIYQINLDPKRLYGEPAVIEARFGTGKVLLSLVHFDTPDDRNGTVVFKNLWKYLVPNAGCGMPPIESVEGKLRAECRESEIQKKQADKIDPGYFAEIETAVADLIDLGYRNFLWFWRNPMLLQWRRGVRGLEYCTLYIMVKQLVEVLGKQDEDRKLQDFDINLSRTRQLLLPFVDKAKYLLLLERLAMQNTHITYDRCDDPEIQALREELFSLSKSHGGLFKELLDEIDRLLYSVLKQLKL